jgi:hypothetical protein
MDSFTRIPLKKPFAQDAASQTREMGLKIGDTIIGREEYGPGWSEAKLKLIWRGASVAVFEKWSHNHYFPEWSYQGEDSNWTLNCREWFLIQE